jgi:hypothetical protein
VEIPKIVRSDQEQKAHSGVIPEQGSDCFQCEGRTIPVQFPVIDLKTRLGGCCQTEHPETLFRRSPGRTIPLEWGERGRNEEDPVEIKLLERRLGQ